MNYGFNIILTYHFLNIDSATVQSDTYRKLLWEKFFPVKEQSRQIHCGCQKRQYSNWTFTSAGVTCLLAVPEKRRCSRMARGTRMARGSIQKISFAKP